MEATITADGVRLAAHLAAHAGPRARAGVVLCHGFPTGPRGAAASAITLPELADRIANEVGCTALSFSCRGTGTSDGDFSVAGWMEDIGAAVAMVSERPEVVDVWLVGITEGGTLALCVAAHDERVRGVATLAAPASLGAWGRDPGRFLEYAQRAGLAGGAGWPAAAVTVARELQSTDARGCASELPPRPVLVLHGSDDDVVPVSDARALASAAQGDLRVVQAAGHALRHDPRAVAALLGWLDRLV